jgi:hypothetical protein
LLHDVRKAPPAHNTYRETSANDAKRMFVCVNLSALIRAREVKNDKASLRNATQLLCSLWDYTLGEAGTRAGDDNGRRIYYISAGELEEGRRWDNASEVPAVRAEIEDRCAARSSRRQAEGHRHELNLVPAGPHTRPNIVDPDIVGLRKIGFALMGGNRKLQSLHHLAVFGPADVLLVVVTHLGKLEPTPARREG